MAFKQSNWVIKTSSKEKEITAHLLGLIFFSFECYFKRNQRAMEPYICLPAWHGLIATQGKPHPCRKRHTWGVYLTDFLWHFVTSLWRSAKIDKVRHLMWQGQVGNVASQCAWWKGGEGSKDGCDFQQGKLTSYINGGDCQEALRNRIFSRSRLEM